MRVDQTLAHAIMLPKYAQKKFARSGEYVRCTRVYAPGLGYTYLYRPVPVCTPCACVCPPLDVTPRTYTGLLPCVSPVHVCILLDVVPRAGTGAFQGVRSVPMRVRPWTWIYRPVSVRSSV